MKRREATRILRKYRDAVYDRAHLVTMGAAFGDAYEEVCRIEEVLEKKILDAMEQGGTSES